MMYFYLTNLILILLSLFLLRKYLLSRGAQRTFQRLIEHINIGYYRYRSRDGVILAANKGFIKIMELDLPIGDIIGRSLSELLIHVDSEDEVREILRANKAIRNYEYHFKTLKGKDKCVLHNSYVLENRYFNDEIIEVLIEDITEERRSYDLMKESQERYEKLFKSSGDMVLITRFLDGYLLEEINPITEVITGYIKEEIVGQALGDILHPSSRKILNSTKEELLFRGTAQHEAVIVCKDGAYKEVIMTFSVVELKDDQKAMIVIKDVSDIVEEREEQKKRKKELEDFWKASIEREERIRDLRMKIERARKQLRTFKEKNG